MSELTIRSGGIVEVDPASLREAAARLHVFAADVRAAADEAATLAALAPTASAGDAGVALAWSEIELSAGAAAAADLTTALGRAADLYDAVEAVAARMLAAAAGDADAIRLADARLRELIRDDPLAVLRALDLVRGHSPREDLDGQIASMGMVLGPGTGAFLVSAGAVAGLLIDANGKGRVAGGATLTGPAPPVRVEPVRTAAAIPPATLTEAASRIPGGAEARVRVERYVTASGPQFVVYIAGTQSVAGADPFDMGSNLQLYDGEDSASFEAVVAALKDAGAGPGDAVHAFGHSQGAMIGERLAAAGEFDVQTVVSFGSPVQADVGEDTLAVSVRHTDDPVAALQGGGYLAPVTPSGFVVEREADPQARFGDVLLPAHQMSAYAETAALIDASDDPRVDALRARLDGLATGRLGTAVDYAATRVSRPASGGG